jgi:hypothetical protein
MSKNARFALAFCSAVVLTLGACSDDKSDSDGDSDVSPTAAMVPAIQRLVTLAAAEPGEAVDLTACPLGDYEALLTKAPEDVQDLAAAAEGELVAFVFQAAVEGEPANLQCGRSELGAYTGEVPEGDYREDLVHLLEDFIVTFENDSAYKGGTVVRFCTETVGVGGDDFCEADWYDENVWIGVFISGESRSSDLAQEWLVAILDDIIYNVANLSTGIQLLD